MNQDLRWLSRSVFWTDRIETSTYGLDTGDGEFTHRSYSTNVGRRLKLVITGI